MSSLHLDFETASAVDLQEVGLVNYLHHPSTQVLLAAWHVDGVLKQRDYEDGFRDLFTDIERADTIHAWNASFEWGVLNIVMGYFTPMSKMRCTMAHALYRAFPAKLDTCAKALGFAGKHPEGERLIRVFSMGKAKAKLGDWEKFKHYNRVDVEQEVEIAHRLAPHPWPEEEIRVWMMSEEINWRGVPISERDARAARALHSALVQNATARLQQITGLAKVNSQPKMVRWLAERGVRTTSLDKETMPTLLAQVDPEGEVFEALKLRQQIALRAPDKFEVAYRHARHGRLFNMLQYSGAGRTHRWSGRGLQPQNMRRGWKDDAAIEQAWRAIHLGSAEVMETLYDDPFTVLADLVRSIIMVEKEDYPLAVADYSSIEVVMLHWAAGDSGMLKAFRDGLDPYKVYGASHFDVPYDAITKEQRTFSKPVVLGCGYGLGKDTLVEYAANMGVTMDITEAARAVYTYREKNTKVVRLWYGLQEAMGKTIITGKPHRFGHFRFSFRDGACIMHLPAGTEITYWDAQVDPSTDRISYMGVDQYTGQWKRLSTWGGKLVENAVQSISRDVLVYGLFRAREAGVEVVLHVHDEIVAPAPDTAVLDTLLRCMSPPPWCADAPIHAAGFLCPRYRKD